MGHPPKVVRMLAALLKELFTHPFEQYSPFLPKSPWWGCSDAIVPRRQVKPMLGAGARPPQTPPRTKSSGSTMPLQQMPILGRSRMATLRNALLPWNSWAHCFFASTWWPNRANYREEFASRWAVTTQATSSACSTSRPRNHTRRHCSWNWFSSFIVRAVALLPTTSPDNTTPGRMN